MLRPPTFEVLAKTLRAAKDAGRPYHVLRFDGHGAHLEIEKYLEGLEIDRHRYSPQLYPRTARRGRHGYLLFENPAVTSGRRTKTSSGRTSAPARVSWSSRRRPLRRWSSR